MSDHESAPFRILTWQEAEYFAAAFMKSLGFVDAEVTPAGTDGGVDVRSKAAVAQVKHFSAVAIGSPTVQQLVGAGHSKRYRLFFALSGFTAAAVRLAEETNTALFAYTEYGVVTPASTAAMGLNENGFVMWDPETQTAARTKVVRDVQEYGQSVASTAAALLREIPDWVARVKELRDREPGAAPPDTLAAEAEARMLLHLGTRLNGIRTEALADFVQDFETVEGIAYQFAKRLGVDYDEVAARALTDVSCPPSE